MISSSPAPVLPWCCCGHGPSSPVCSILRRHTAGHRSRGGSSTPRSSWPATSRRSGETQAGRTQDEPGQETHHHQSPAAQGRHRQCRTAAKSRWATQYRAQRDHPMALRGTVISMALSQLKLQPPPMKLQPPPRGPEDSDGARVRGELIAGLEDGRRPGGTGGTGVGVELQVPVALAAVWKGTGDGDRERQGLPPGVGHDEEVVVDQQADPSAARSGLSEPSR